MGEYAEMMLDGTCCEGCGEYLRFGNGMPAYCSEQCANNRGAGWFSVPVPVQIKKTKCPECGKRVKLAGLKDHLCDMHSSKAPNPPEAQNA